MLALLKLEHELLQGQARNRLTIAVASMAVPAGFANECHALVIAILLHLNVDLAV